jgi:hypothetical protein
LIKWLAGCARQNTYSCIPFGILYLSVSSKLENPIRRRAAESLAESLVEFPIEDSQKQ